MTSGSTRSASRRQCNAYAAAIRSENNVNHTFCYETIPTAPDDRLVLQEVAGKIRYLEEQWNFAADQRIRAALSIEKQWNLSGVRNRRIVVTLRARGHRRRGLG
jgi:hypothetical protein